MNESIVDDVSFKQESLLTVFAQGLGPLYMWLFGLAAIVSLGLILLVLWRGKGPTVGPALVLLSLAPLLLGILSYYHGMFEISRFVGTMCNQPSLSAEAATEMNLSTGMIVGCLISLLCMAVAATGAVIRAVKSPDPGGN